MWWSRCNPNRPRHNCPDDSALRKEWFQGRGRGQWDRSRQSGDCLDDAGGKDAGYPVISGMIQETRMLLGIRCFWNEAEARMFWVPSDFWDEAETRMLLGTQWLLGWGRRQGCWASRWKWDSTALLRTSGPESFHLPSDHRGSFSAELQSSVSSFPGCILSLPCHLSRIPLRPYPPFPF